MPVSEEKIPAIAYWYSLIGNLIGWIWLLSIPVTLWALYQALFGDGPWRWVVLSIMVGGVAKGVTRTFLAASDRAIDRANT